MFSLRASPGTGERVSVMPLSIDQDLVEFRRFSLLCGFWQTNSKTDNLVSTLGYIIQFNFISTHIFFLVEVFSHFSVNILGVETFICI